MYTGPRAKGDWQKDKMSSLTLSPVTLSPDQMSSLTLSPDPQP